MKVELYSFPDCPSRALALENLKRSLRAEGLPEDIDQVSVDVAATAGMRFLGSPTIRIVGVDVDGLALRRQDTPDPSARAILMANIGGRHARSSRLAQGRARRRFRRSEKALLSPDGS